MTTHTTHATKSNAPATTPKKTEPAAEPKVDLYESEPPFGAVLRSDRPNPATLTAAEQNRHEVLTGERVQRPPEPSE